jgi:hypothetical protein
MSIAILFVALIGLWILGVLLRRFISGPMRWIFVGLLGFLAATLVRYRAFPFLHADTILSGGKLVPTAEWSVAIAKFFYVGSAAFVLIGLVWLVLGVAWAHRVAKTEKLAHQRSNHAIERTAGSFGSTPP